MKWDMRNERHGRKIPRSLRRYNSRQIEAYWSQTALAEAAAEMEAERQEFSAYLLEMHNLYEYEPDEDWTEHQATSDKYEGSCYDDYDDDYYDDGFDFLNDPDCDHDPFLEALEHEF